MENRISREFALFEATELRMALMDRIAKLKTFKLDAMSTGFAYEIQRSQMRCEVLLNEARR